MWSAILRFAAVSAGMRAAPLRHALASGVYTQSTGRFAHVQCRSEPHHRLYFMELVVLCRRQRERESVPVEGRLGRG